MDSDDVEGAGLEYAFAEQEEESDGEPGPDRGNVLQDVDFLGLEADSMDSR